MSSAVVQFTDVAVSLADLIGEEYVDAVCAARAAVSGEDITRLRALATEPVACYPQTMQDRLSALLPYVGQPVCASIEGRTAPGVTSQQFQAATHTAMAPLTGYGYYRVSENGWLYLISKSEHYHAPLGHAFPGYELVQRAKQLGIPNATHNNTRGHVTRLLEAELLRGAHGLSAVDSTGLDAVLRADSMNCVNRVLNLETGSLAAEAALKMMLARFYAPQEGVTPRYADRTPVVVVIGNDDGGLQANYHGTTVLTQALRGMWPTFLDALEQQDILRVCAVRPNNVDDLEQAFRQYEQGKYKIAGFFHEIVMMNYGARLLTRDFLDRAYALCAAHDVPTAVDEIQSCMWAPGYFQFREYGLQPSFVIIGKGFPGGEYPASRILFSAQVDNLPQFGALVTNGQEELAALAYLVTMRWASVNAEAIRRLGDYFEEQLRAFGERHADSIDGIEGRRHLAGVRFPHLARAKAFVARLNKMGFDISVQTYKADCPPTVLAKLPITVGTDVIDFFMAKMEEAMVNLVEPVG